MSAVILPEQKYSKDGAFCEPIVRCDGCAKLILVAELHKLGMCPNCSNTRVKNARTLNGDEMEMLKAMAAEGKIDPDFIALFEVMQ